MPFACLMLRAIWCMAQPCASTPFEWAYTGSLTTSRFAHAATALANGDVLVTGGLNAAGYTGTAEIYNSADGTWASTLDMETVREGHTATLLLNGKVLGALSSMEIFEFIEQTNSASQKNHAKASSPKQTP